MNDDKGAAGVLPRRRFLGGAAAAVTLAAGATLTSARPAKAASGPAPLSVAYWDGKRLVSAAQLPGGDARLVEDGIRVTVDAPTCTTAPGAPTNGVAAASVLRAVNAHYPIVDQDGAEISVPFYAWTASAHGQSASTFSMPVHTAKGVTLGVESRAGEHLCPFTTGTKANATPLREGTYVIAVGATPTWMMCRFDPTETKAPLTRRTRGGVVPVTFDYVVVTVARA